LRVDCDLPTFSLRSVEPEKRRCQARQRMGVELNSFQIAPRRSRMETPKAPETARGETTLIGTSIVIKGELSCGEDLYIDGQVEGTIRPERKQSDDRAARAR